jgi:[acyl-carrier-protein] S-malonyltransferase
MEKGKLAYLFPGQGQGSIKVGMGRKLWEKFIKARKIFRQADQYLDWSISEVCFFGPEEELLKTKNSQVASLVVNLAYLAALEETEESGKALDFKARGQQPDYLAGHSAGEHTAFVLAGSISFYQALDIIARVRAPEMSKAAQLNPGYMVVLIDPDTEEVKKLMKRFGLGGNFNSESQIVLSGATQTLKEAEEEVRQKKLARKIIPLGTEGAFHSDCMKPALEPLERYFRDLPFAKPKIPVIGNSEAREITSVAEAKRDLIDHICQPLLWQQSLENMYKAGVRTFVEVGHGEVLSNNIKRDKKLKVKVVALSNVF